MMRRANPDESFADSKNGTEAMLPSKDHLLNTLR